MTEPCCWGGGNRLASAYGRHNDTLLAEPWLTAIGHQREVEADFHAPLTDVSFNYSTQPESFSWAVFSRSMIFSFWGHFSSHRPQATQWEASLFPLVMNI